MLLIPAIDLKDGQCVRLRQGVLENATIFSDKPVEVALQWRDLGARRLHLVDLNGAVAGKPKNLGVIREILQEVGNDLPVQLGGGLRNLDTIESYLDMGIEYVIIGTAAVKTPGFLHDACDAFPAQVIVGLDAKEGTVMTDGWTKATHHQVVDLARRFEDYGVISVIYTDIGRDGMMTGVNIEATTKLAQALKIPVIASGGLTDLEDVRRLVEVEPEGVEAVVTGRAIYEGSIRFDEAQQLADQLSSQYIRIPLEE